ncbi:MAG: hypothetical protein GY906_28005 [bacterium]|nr:hypothetical protein [bacterium]
MNFRFSQVVLPIVLFLVASGIPAQDVFEPAANPYQGQFDYAIGDRLEPGVEVGGLRWRTLRISTKPGKAIKRGKANPVTVEIVFQNVTDRPLNTQITFVLEDEIGYNLFSHTCEPIRVRARGTEADQQKIKLQADVLNATKKISVICDVE